MYMKKKNKIKRTITYKRCWRHLIITNNKRLQTNANFALTLLGIVHLNIIME